MLRISLLAVAIWLAYWWRTSQRRETSSRLFRFFVVALTCSFIVAFWAIHLPIEFYSFWYVHSFSALDWQRRLKWFALWHNDVSEWMPLHVMIVGAVIGYILADQKPVAERPASRRAVG